MPLHMTMPTRKIELSTWETLPQKVDSLKKSLEIIYNAKLTNYSQNIPLNNLFPTEDFLENDKIAIVFKKTVTDAYDVPIIAAERNNDYFVLDGHHRCYINTKLKKKTIKVEVLKFPQGTSYRQIPKSSIEDLPFKEVGTIEDPILKTWGRILNILKQYEALYHMHFYLKRKTIALRDVSPTQPEVSKTQIERIDKVLVPIVCVEHNNKYYVLDGHARCLRAKQSDLKSIPAMILTPQISVNFGIVNTAKEMGIRTLNDITILT
jgi:hypothetical protein